MTFGSEGRLLLGAVIFCQRPISPAALHYHCDMEPRNLGHALVAILAVAFTSGSAIAQCSGPACSQYVIASAALAAPSVDPRDYEEIGLSLRKAMEARRADLESRHQLNVGFDDLVAQFIRPGMTLNTVRAIFNGAGLWVDQVQRPGFPGDPYWLEGRLLEGKSDGSTIVMSVTVTSVSYNHTSPILEAKGSMGVVSRQ